MIPKLAICPNVEKLYDYLTPNKEYSIIEIFDRTEKYGYLFSIIDDDGDKTICKEKHCHHLHCKNWILK